MLGALAGDIVGSRFEGMGRFPRKSDFSLFPRNTRFTDDTVLTVATAEAILEHEPYSTSYLDFYNLYPKAGYGSSFKEWAKAEKKEPYNSWGNGSAMRVSPIAWAFQSEEDVLVEAKKSAEVTHNHPEGVKGAQAVALAIFMMKDMSPDMETKKAVEKEISERFGYDLFPPIKDEWDVSCQGCVPQAFCAFFNGNGFEDVIRKAIFRGGDSDTIASIAGALAEPFYGVPQEFVEGIYHKLDEELSETTTEFVKQYVDPSFEPPEKEEFLWKKLFDVFVK